MSTTAAPRSPGWAHELLADGAWGDGRPVVVVGGGPSLADLPPAWWGGLDRLAAREEVRVIATNGRMRLLPAAVGLTADTGAPATLADAPNRLRLVAARHDRGDEPPPGWTGLHVRRERDANGTLAPWPRRLRDGLVTAGNSGCAAVCLADVLAAGRATIYLLGLDYDDAAATPRKRRTYERWRGALDWYRADLASPAVVVGPSRLSGRWPRTPRPWWWPC